jgi:D-amino-acid dehydrogenase
MKIIVLGGGIVGVTTAYFLAKDGHEVELVDRQPLAANETSFSNAGMIAPGHAYTWASPRAPQILLQSLWRRDTALRFRLSTDPRMWWWSWLFLRQCDSAKAARNTSNKLRLCLYSQSMLERITNETGISYHRLKTGAVYMHREPAALERAVANMKILADQGVPLARIDPPRIAEIEPALAAASREMAGAIHSPTDESGDCHVFANALARHCAERLGVTFRWETRIERIVATGDRIEKVVTDRGELAADAYVMALGSYASIEARRIGVSLPIYPIKGYALTLDIGGRNGAPNLSGVDEHYLIGWSRLGPKLRVTATAEFAGYDTTHKPADFAHMLTTARRLFPDGADFERPYMWAGLRPMTPKGTPILGRGPHKNLWYNAGQGHMGWTMSHGSARIIADLIAGKTPEIDMTGLTVADAA